MPLTVKQSKDLSRDGESGISIDGVDVNNIVLVGMVSKIDNAVSDCTFRSLNFGVAFRPVTDFNEIANHFIEGIYVHLYNTNLRVRVEALGGMTTQPEVANSNFGNPTKSYGYQTNLTNQFSGQHNTVEEQIRGVSSKTGVPSDVVARELNVSYDKIRPVSFTVWFVNANTNLIVTISSKQRVYFGLDKKSLEFLVSEGLDYTTIDDHYKFTDA
ncbi:hypothetical protein Gotri_021468 [Gossypium trilobum]|uniref:Uncharacterized protein n=1 Tax=Gossypium trilobum TaxID=34281 RepID=A0A7J9DCL0_9ROSI|nr:hypothetical protein [Gossypium trilobum]